MGSRAEATGRRSALAVLGWAGLAILVIGAFLAAFGALNQTVYGAASFVQRYLEAVASGDVAAAVATPGVDLSAEQLEAMGLPATTSRALLRGGLIETSPEGVRVVSDVARADGTHEVTASYRLGASIVETEFDVRPIEPLYGVLNRWAFAESPLAVVDVSVQHGSFFEVGGLELDTRAAKSGDELAAFSQTAPYLVIAPAEYAFSYDSPLLHAEEVIAAAGPSTRSSVTLEMQPTPEFVKRVQQQVDQFLTERCATEPVLQPAGCPFGAIVEDRVTSEPQWTIVSSPTVTLVPGDRGFNMPPTEGVAHLSVEVQSLYDGSIEQLEEDHPFTMSLTAVVRPDGNIEVQLL